MAASLEDWSCDSNKAVRVSLVRPGPSDSNLSVVHQFHPKFTYPVFGEEEMIFGYQGLDIEISFAAHDCRPHVSIKYDKKFAKVGDVRPMDCSKILHEFLPPPAFEDMYADKLKNDTRAKTWTPPGQKVHTYERKGTTFEIWGGSLSDLNIRNLLDQIQIFVLFFIEGGQMLPLDDPEWTLARWHVYFIYEKTQVSDQQNVSPYVLAGYTTTYRCWTFTPVEARSKIDFSNFPSLEEIDITKQNCRLRIAQFVILPPWQSNGHGTELYQTIYRLVMDDSTIMELTVEDPSEEFDKLRDVNDWRTLEPAFRTANVQINTTAVAKQARFEKMPKKRLLDLTRLEEIRKQHKMAPRQFYRAMELFFLAQVPFSHRASGGASLTRLLVKKHRSTDPVDVKYYWLRNLIKQRIWYQNKDKFVDMPATEISEKLNDTARGQEDEYEGYLLRLAAKAAADLNSNGSSGGIPMAVARKRRVLDDDDDDEGAASDASKRVRSAK